jgi:hypothetical protein
MSQIGSNFRCTLNLNDWEKIKSAENKKYIHTNFERIKTQIIGIRLNHQIYSLYLNGNEWGVDLPSITFSKMMVFSLSKSLSPWQNENFDV